MKGIYQHWKIMRVTCTQQTFVKIEIRAHQDGLQEHHSCKDIKDDLQLH